MAFDKKLDCNVASAKKRPPMQAVFSVSVYCVVSTNQQIAISIEAHERQVIRVDVTDEDVRVVEFDQGVLAHASDCNVVFCRANQSDEVLHAVRTIVEAVYAVIAVIVIKDERVSEFHRVAVGAVAGEHVVAVAADQNVFSVTAKQFVVAPATVDSVIAGTSHNAVIACTGADLVVAFIAEDAVVTSTARDDVSTLAAANCISVLTAFEAVVAVLAVDCVLAAVTGNGVIASISIDCVAVDQTIDRVVAHISDNRCSHEYPQVQKSVKVTRLKLSLFQ